MNRYLIFIFLIIFTSCKKEIKGIYVSNYNLKDSLFISSKEYSRKYDNLKLTSNYWIEDNRINLSNWVNKGELPIGSDTMNVSFNCSYNVSNKCYKIIFDPNNDYGYFRIE